MSLSLELHDFTLISWNSKESGISPKLECQNFLENHDQNLSNLFFGNNMLKNIAKTPSNIPNASLRSELKNPQKN